MVRVEIWEGSPLYVCEECGFGYREREYAEMCEEFCRKTGACSLEITKFAARKPEV